MNVVAKNPPRTSIHLSPATPFFPAEGVFWINYLSYDITMNLFLQPPLGSFWLLRAVLCACRSDVAGRLRQVSERGGEQHHAPGEAGPERRHDPSPLQLFHQLLTQHIPHGCAHSSCMHAHATTLLDHWTIALLHHLFDGWALHFGNMGLVARVNKRNFIPRRSVTETRPCISGPAFLSRCPPRGYPIKSGRDTRFIDIHELNISFDSVVTVTGSWQCTSIAGFMQGPFSPQWLLEFIYSNLFEGERETIESLEWIKFLQRG